MFETANARQKNSKYLIIHKKLAKLISVALKTTGITYALGL